jgi:rod shape-determining protein MreD
MRQWALAVGVLALVAIVQNFALPYFRIAGVRFDLMMAVLIAWSFVRGIDEAMVVVPLGGFMVSFFALEPLGASMIAYAPIVPLALARNFQAIGPEPLMAAVVALVATFLHAILYLTVLDGTGYSPDWAAGLIEVTIPAAFMNMLAAPALIYLMRRFDRVHRGPEVGISFTAAGRPRGRRLEFR